MLPEYFEKENGTTEKKKRVAAYVRVSTDMEDQLHSLESQSAYFREFIDQHSEWHLVQIYADRGLSGTTVKHRPAFCAMVQAAMEGEIDLILTKEISRFARNTVDALAWTRKLREAGVEVWFVSENIHTMESDGEFRLAILASVAQEESRKTSERVRWGMSREMERGRAFGRIPYGYRIQAGVLIPEPEEAAVVLEIFQRYAREGESVSSIAKELSARKTPGRMVWHGATVSRMLSNEKYVGNLLQHKTYTPDFLSHRAVRSSRSVQQLLTAHHVPIVPRELWTAVQRRREMGTCRSVSGAVRQTHSRYDGRVFCGYCKKTCLRRSKRRTDGSIYFAWYCREDACPHQQTGEDCIDGVIEFLTMQGKGAQSRKDGVFFHHILLFSGAVCLTTKSGQPCRMVFWERKGKKDLHYTMESAQQSERTSYGGCADSPSETNS